MVDPAGNSTTQSATWVELTHSTSTTVEMPFMAKRTCPSSPKIAYRSLQFCESIRYGSIFTGSECYR